MLPVLLDKHFFKSIPPMSGATKCMGGAAERWDEEGMIRRPAERQNRV
jgi:hypothetical protein